MLKNYLLTVLRNMRQQQLYTLINVLGLAIGISCFTLIGLWVKEELSYDHHFKEAGRIYRIANDLITDGRPSALAQADPRIADHLRADFPSAGTVTRLVDKPTLLTVNGVSVYEQKAYYADSNFFDVFTHRFVEGNSSTAMRQPQGIVLTESVARRLFGSQQALGRQVCFGNDRTLEARPVKVVTGVIRDEPDNTHFHPGVIIVANGLADMFEYVYIRFNPGFTPARFEQEVWPKLYSTYFRQEYAQDHQALSLALQPVTRIHLHSARLWEHEPGGSAQTIYIFILIACFILLVAVSNYMNLVTARHHDRSQEIGIRKVIGATRQQLIAQLLTEALVFSLIALLLALSFTEIALPWFNGLAGKHLRPPLTQPDVLLGLLVLALLTGLASGIYPALRTAALPATQALYRTPAPSPGKPVLRKTLVVVQFSISILMLIATFIITMQLGYLKQQDLGFNQEQVLQIRLNDPVTSNRTPALKAALLRHPGILQAAASHNTPGGELYELYHEFETEDGRMQSRLMTTLLVDQDYAQLIGLKLTAGRGFDSSMLTGLKTGLYVLLNESAVRALGWHHPVGMRICTGKSGGSKAGYCIGVVKDIHTTSLAEAVRPTVFRLTAKSFRYLSVRIRSGPIKGTMNFIRQTMKSFSPDYPFEYSFLSQAFNLQYRQEEQQAALVGCFTGLCIFISCLGLLGLASFATRQRHREISIRRVAGASIRSIILLLARDLLKPVLTAILVAIPAAWVLMHYWLQHFACHIQLSWPPFLVAGSAAIIISLLTISLHTIKAANTSPAHVLKHE